MTQTAIRPGVAGKVAIVTGAASGIGLAVAERLVAAGAKVLLVDQNVAVLQKTVAKLGDHAKAVAVDVSDTASATHYVAEAEKHFGPVQLAVLNAGINGPVARIEDVPIADFDKVIAVNLRSVWLGLAALLPAMRRAGGGAIVATSSTAGLRGAARLAPYVASKHAIIGLVKSAALEAARDGVRVNAVCPGPVDTGMIAAIEAGFLPADPPKARKATIGRVPLGRLGTVEDVASLMLFLLSPEAAFITGSAYTVDGGVMSGLGE
jgi:NAD(P)-dependent dehydrogenase (short-subunit alcohol dehydrogenase family)